MSKNTITTIGLDSINGLYSVVVIRSKGKDIISTTRSEPDILMCAIEEFKVKASELFMEKF